MVSIGFNGESCFWRRIKSEEGEEKEKTLPGGQLESKAPRVPRQASPIVQWSFPQQNYLVFIRTCSNPLFVVPAFGTACGDWSICSSGQWLRGQLLIKLCALHIFGFPNIIEELQ